MPNEAARAEIAMSQIIPMILERFRETLQVALVDEIPDDDPTRATLVKVGRFQEDPTLRPVYVAISGGDPEDPNYKDGIVTLEGMDNIGFELPAREIGGGQYWWRRGILQVGCYYVVERYPESAAMEYAYTVLGRIEKALEETFVADLIDDYGEQAVLPFLYANSFFESGGPPADYIYRGKVYWSVLTARGGSTY